MDFLRDSSNKEELFDYLTKSVAARNWPEEKEIYITQDTSAVHKGFGEPMLECTHEEADTRIIIHLLHALEAGSRKIKVRTVDTDILVILIGHFFSLLQSYPDLELWIVLGVGKDYCYYKINNIWEKLGESKSRSLPAFHAFSGCDTTSCFFRKGKKSAWKAWKCYPEATEAFLSIAEKPFDELNAETFQFRHLERLTVVMYDSTSTLSSVNEARRELFSKKGKSLENIPPTQVSIAWLLYSHQCYY